MKSCALFTILIFCCFGYSQEMQKENDVKKTSHTYAKFDLSFSIKGNEYYGETDPDTGQKEPFLIPEGIATRFGFGVKPIKWIAIGANLGIDWKGSRCLVVAPIFGTLRIIPKTGEDLNFYIEPGIGRALALGKNDLAGYFKKISIGLEDNESGGFGLYIEYCQYGFKKDTTEKIGSFSIGLTYKMHKYF